MVLVFEKFRGEVITFSAEYFPVLSIRNASPSDIGLIRRLCFQVWPQTYAPVLSKAQIDYMLDLMYSEKALLQQMEQGHRFLLLYDEDEPIGFASYSEIAPKLWKLHKLYVLPVVQGKGGGRKLVDFVLTDLKKEGGERLQLNVNRHNKAKDFYHRLGFSVAREEDIDIGNGYFMSDYIMERQVDQLTG